MIPVLLFPCRERHSKCKFDMSIPFYQMRIAYTKSGTALRDSRCLNLSSCKRWWSSAPASMEWLFRCPSMNFDRFSDSLRAQCSLVQMDHIKSVKYAPHFRVWNCKTKNSAGQFVWYMHNGHQNIPLSSQWWHFVVHSPICLAGWLCCDKRAYGICSSYLPTPIKLYLKDQSSLHCDVLIALKVDFSVSFLIKLLLN